MEEFAITSRCLVDKLTELMQEDNLEWVFELQRVLLSVDWPLEDVSYRLFGESSD